MDRAYKSGASTTAPTAPASPSLGYPTSGDPVAGVPKTVPGPYLYHMLVEELRNIVVAGGVVPNHLVLNQVLTALQGLFVGVSSFTGANQALAAAGYQRLPGGLILQWGVTNVGDIAGATAFNAAATFPIAFPNACLGLVGSAYRSGGDVFATITDSFSTRFGCSFVLNEWAAVGQNIGARYIAIGW